MQTGHTQSPGNSSRTPLGMAGIDIGGTFTDIVYYIPPQSQETSGGKLAIYKVPSTPSNPVQGLLAALHALDAGQDTVVIHGSTVATNALLERKGARAALVTTAGFADVFE